VHVENSSRPLLFCVEGLRTAPKGEDYVTVTTSGAERVHKIKKGRFKTDFDRPGDLEYVVSRLAELAPESTTEAAGL
jgi:hypothetical protein